MLAFLTLACAWLSCVSASLFAPSDRNILYSGRTTSDYRFEWSGVSIAVGFTGTSISAIFDDSNGQNMFNAFIDGNQVEVLNLTKGQSTYDIASGMPSGDHTVLLTRRTEAFAGQCQFLGFNIDDGAESQSVPVPSRRIEFVGDSITCGYGNMGKYPCSFSLPTENNYESYGPMTARALDADLYLEAWSGRGMVRNYGDPNITSQQPFPDLYPFVFPAETSEPYNFTSSWIPDVVVINLGTNDYSTAPAPPQDIFETAYVAFIGYVRKMYGASPKFFLVCGPMENSQYCPYTSNVAATVGETYVSMVGLLNYPQDFGCDGHPNVGGHTKMAANITATIKSAMGW